MRAMDALHIDTLNGKETAMRLEELKKKKPTQEWKERISEEDDIFSDENIIPSEEALDAYIDCLAGLGAAPAQEEIMACVAEVVLNFNELNDEHYYFIETMEREELWAYIDRAARAAGLKAPEGADITEEWREW